MQRLLAISGKRFYGKDTFARLLVDAARAGGRELPTYAFADESKRMFAATQPEVDLARLLGDRAYKEAWRPALTQFTVEALARDPLVFCREVCRRIEAGGVPALVTDLRLVLEHDHLAPRFDLHVLRLQRGDDARRAAGWEWSDGVDDHRTECELDDPARWNEVVPNDGTMDELAARAADAITRLVP